MNGINKILKNYIEKIKLFWSSSYNSDKIAFYFELFSFLLVVTGSVKLAITATNPDMRYIYPLYFLGSLTALYAHCRRKLVWPTLLVGHFCIINIYGWLVATKIL